MMLSLFLAKLIGIYFLVVAAVWIFRKKQFETGYSQIFASSGLLMLDSMIKLAIGLAIAIAHPLFTFDFRGVVTLLGYLAIISGVIRLTYPNKIKAFTLAMLGRYNLIAIIVLVVLGAFLTVSGFWLSH